MRAQALLWVLSCTLGITCMASAAPTTPPPSAHALRAQAAPRLSRSDALARLKELEKKYSQDIESTNQSMRRILSESQSVSLHQSDSVRTEKHLLSLPQRLADLQRQRQDLLLKREFLDQLIFHIDSKWTTQPLSLLLEQTLLDMAGSELTSSQPQTQDKPDFWRFYIYLSIAIREIPEPQEDIIAFIASYMNFSAINAPRSPLAFLESRSYIGGAMTQLAHPSRRDEVGAIVERKLKSLGWKDENSGDGTRSGMTMQTTEQTTEQNTEQTTDSAKSIDLDQD